MVRQRFDAVDDPCNETNAYLGNSWIGVPRLDVLEIGHGRLGDANAGGHPLQDAEPGLDVVQCELASLLDVAQALDDRPHERPSLHHLESAFDSTYSNAFEMGR